MRPQNVSHSSEVGSKGYPSDESTLLVLVARPWSLNFFTTCCKIYVKCMTFMNRKSTSAFHDSPIMTENTSEYQNTDISNNILNWGGQNSFASMKTDFSLVLRSTNGKSHLKSLTRPPQVFVRTLTSLALEKQGRKDKYFEELEEQLRRGVNQTQVYFQTWARRQRWALQLRSSS